MDAKHWYSYEVIDVLGYSTEDQRSHSRHIDNFSAQYIGHPEILNFQIIIVIYYYFMILQNSQQEMNRKQGHN